MLVVSPHFFLTNSLFKKTEVRITQGHSYFKSGAWWYPKTRVGFLSLSCWRGDWWRVWQWLLSHTKPQQTECPWHSYECMNAEWRAPSLPFLPCWCLDERSRIRWPRLTRFQRSYQCSMYDAPVHTRLWFALGYANYSVRELYLIPVLWVHCNKQKVAEAWNKK